jgi:hypothetical protein
MALRPTNNVEEIVTNFDNDVLLGVDEGKKKII